MNLNRIPLEDGYKTTLQQSWDGNTGKIFVKSLPNFTFPSGVTTFVVVDPNNSNRQVAEIDSYNVLDNSLNVTNITLELGAGVPSTTKLHSANAEIIISDNYEFWNDIRDGINSKIDRETGQGEVYADETARDTAIPTPGNGMQVYVTSLGAFTDYQGGVWLTRASGATPNAEEGVAGKVELATQAEFDAGTDLGGTGASLVGVPSQIQGMKGDADIGITGEVRIWTTATAPITWLICDGAAVNRITYADLFATIGETYGAGDGVNTFNIPDLKGRVPVGLDSGDADFNLLGENGGAKTDNHNHDYIVPEDGYGVDSTNAAGNNGIFLNAGSGDNLGSQNGDRSLTTDNTAVSTVQPYLTINYIIKT